MTTKLSKKKPWPRGISVYARTDRPNSFRTVWWENGKRHTREFPTKERAHSFASDIASHLAEHGKRALTFNPREWDKYLEFKNALDGADLNDVLAVWKEHLVRKRRSSISLATAVTEYLQIVTNEGITDDHLLHVKKHLERLTDFVGGETALGEISSPIVRDWLVMLEDEGNDGEGFAPLTVRHHLKSARAFFTRALAEHWLSEHPADKSRVKGPKVKQTAKVALSLDEAKKLLAANRNHRVVGRLALEMFGGLRYTSAIRLVRDDINWKDKFIVLDAARHKSGQGHILEDLPENLWAWLRHADKLDRFWEMTQRQYLEEKSAAFSRAGIENTGNVLRRSFCSWMITLHGDAKKVAAWMQHRSPDMLYRQYRTSRTHDGFVTKSDAPKWLKLRP